MGYKLSKFKQQLLNDLNIQTPGLQFLVLYFGHVGVQMQKVHFSSPRFFINFAWNLAIDCALFYGFINLDPFQLGPLRASCAITKPMFNYLVQINDRFVYPFFFVVNIGYSYFYSASIIHLLDSDAFHQYYARGNRWKSIYLGFIGAHFVLFFLFFFDKIQLSDELPLWKKLITYGCMYSSLYQYWICGILHYSRYATWGILRQIEKKLSGMPVVHLVEQFQIVEEIRLLANINEKLSQYLSFPILAFTVLNIFNIIMFLSMAFLCTPNLGLLMHVFVSAFYLVFIIVLNHKLSQSLKRIFCAVQEKQNIAPVLSLALFQMTGLVPPLQSVPQNRLLQTALHTELHRFGNANRHLKSHLFESTSSRIIRYAQLDLYQKYFQIRIFRLVTLDLNYLLQVSLFILSYIVLISQTNY